MAKNRDTALVIFGYNRPDYLARLLAIVNQHWSNSVHIFLDGPKNRIDKVSCAECRSVAKQYPHYSLHISRANKGLKLSIIQGLNTIFRQYDSVIVLEDDCLPDPSFFPFVLTMLHKYRDDKRVMSLTGSNSTQYISKTSYLFSIYPNSWGWATWRRAWQLYQPQIDSRPEINHVLKDTFGDDSISKWYWSCILQLVASDHISTWDYQWSYTCWKYRGLTIVPSVNLIQNIGYGQTATNTRWMSDGLKQVASRLNKPYTHPKRIVASKAFDLMRRRVGYINMVSIAGLVKKMIVRMFV